MGDILHPKPHAWGRNMGLDKQPNKQREKKQLNKVHNWFLRETETGEMARLIQ